MLKNTITSIEFAEDLLGTIEAFFATSKFESLFFNKSEVLIDIREYEFTKYPGEFIYDEQTEKITIKIPELLSNYQSKDDQKTFVNFLLENIVHIFVHSTIPLDDFRKVIFKLAEEGALSRALSISPSYMFMNNVFGESKKYQLTTFLSTI